MLMYDLNTLYIIIVISWVLSKKGNGMNNYRSFFYLVHMVFVRSLVRNAPSSSPDNSLYSLDFQCLVACLRDDWYGFTFLLYCQCLNTTNMVQYV